MIVQIEPWIDEEELKELAEVIRSTWITEAKKTQEFEEKIAQLTGAKHAISIFNGTVGLYVALVALGIGPGDQVAVPDLTFIASANAVKMAGAEPLLVDVDERTFTLDPLRLEEKLTQKTKAIMPVHLYGQSADMEAIMEVARRRGLFVVEDAAQGVGVKFQGQHVGTFGEIGVLSFYGNKTITTAEGGMLLTNDDELARKCWRLKNHGREVKGSFIHPFLGFNFCFTELQAAVGLAQLRKLDRIIRLKKHHYELYQEKLATVPEVRFPYVDARCQPVYWFTSLLVEDPQALADYLKRKDIGTRRFFYPIHRQPCYNLPGQFPNTDYAYEHGLSLPSSALLTEEEIATVCDSIREFYRGK